jgi:hypothetical protein
MMMLVTLYHILIKMEFLTNNWATLALALITAAGTITALTETEKDDKIVNVLQRILQAVVLGKNRKK